MEAFDPLALENIGVTLAVELVEQPLHDLPPQKFVGAGVYALYYTGKHSAYSQLVAMNNQGGTRYPVYIGSAVRENAKQGFNPRPTTSTRLWTRLTHHAKSIQGAVHDPAFRLDDFQCRFLVLNDAHITLAESVLIATFRPAWNGMGFGSKVVGGPRSKQKASLWDALHPGRIGRPAGDAARQLEAQDKIAECIQKLGVPATDPRSIKMMDKIMRFL